MNPTSLAPYQTIGLMKTCFQEKFGVPRQSMMVTEARGILKLNPDPLYRDALRHLETFSHIWIVFLFHDHLGMQWRPTIAPPRIDAPAKVGVFASRSPHRPNPIGLSVVRLEKIDFDAKGGIEIEVSGVDLLNGTPVIDIKPYVPYADSFPDANAGWTDTKIPRYPVTFSEQSLEQIQSLNSKYQHFSKNGLKALIEQMLSFDPRPTSQRASLPLENPEQEGHPFAFRMLDFDVKWEIRNKGIFVKELHVNL